VPSLPLALRLIISLMVYIRQSFCIEIGHFAGSHRVIRSDAVSAHSGVPGYGSGPTTFWLRRAVAHSGSPRGLRHGVPSVCFSSNDAGPRYCAPPFSPPLAWPRDPSSPSCENRARWEAGYPRRGRAHGSGTSSRSPVDRRSVTCATAGSAPGSVENGPCNRRIVSQTMKNFDPPCCWP
jgi:hypothetical protein